MNHFGVNCRSAIENQTKDLRTGEGAGDKRNLDRIVMEEEVMKIIERKR
jgi:hypothetical protein